MTIPSAAMKNNLRSYFESANFSLSENYTAVEGMLSFVSFSPVRTCCNARHMKTDKTTADYSAGGYSPSCMAVVDYSRLVGGRGYDWRGLNLRRMPIRGGSNGVALAY